MNIDEIKKFFIQQAKLAKEIEIAKSNYIDFLEKINKEYFYKDLEDFQFYFMDELEGLLFECGENPNGWGTLEVLESMFFPIIRNQLDSMVNSESITREERRKVEFPYLDQNSHSRIKEYAEYYASRFNTNSEEEM
jgi:hypothetical protein